MIFPNGCRFCLLVSIALSALLAEASPAPSSRELGESRLQSIKARGPRVDGNDKCPIGPAIYELHGAARPSRVLLSPAWEAVFGLDSSLLSYGPYFYRPDITDDRDDAQHYKKHGVIMDADRGYLLDDDPVRQPDSQETLADLIVNNWDTVYISDDGDKNFLYFIVCRIWEKEDRDTLGTILRNTPSYQPGKWSQFYIDVEHDKIQVQELLSTKISLAAVQAYLKSHRIFPQFDHIAVWNSEDGEDYFICFGFSSMDGPCGNYDDDCDEDEDLRADFFHLREIKI